MLLTAAFAMLTTFASAENRRDPKALVIMIDGLRADIVENGDMPNLRMLKEGRWRTGYKAAWSLCASAIRDAITESAPNHAAIATGTTAAKTGVTSNAALLDGKLRYGCVCGNKCPTWLSRLVKAQKERKALFAFSWYGDVMLAPHEGVRYVLDRDERNAEMLERELSRPDAPDAVMWYIDAPDSAGHRYGFYPYSPEYLKAAEFCDGLIGRVLKAIADRSSFDRENWLVFVTSDHGGWERYHGMKSSQAYTVPVIVAGRNVSHGRLAGVVHNYDAAPTALAHFGVNLADADLDGTPIGEAKTATDADRRLSDALAVYLPFDGGTAENVARGSGIVPELTGNAAVCEAGGRGGFLRVSSATNRAGSVRLRGSHGCAFENGGDFAVTLWTRTFGGQVGDPVVFANKNWSAGSNPGMVLIASRHVDMSRTAGYSVAKRGGHSPGFMFNCGLAGKGRMDMGVYNPDHGEWNFYAVTRGRDGVARFYQGRGDGQLYCVAEDASGMEPRTGLDFFIGQDGRGNYRHPFVGDVDDFAMWTRTLSHGEVRRIFNAGRDGKALLSLLGN